MDFEGKRKLAVKRLAEEIVNGRLCVFLGAGCSVEAGLPSWAGLIEKLKTKFEIKSAESDLLRVAARIEKKAGKAAARQAVSDLLRTRPDLETKLQQAIARMPVSLYVTTNYDHLMEDSLRQTGIAPVVVSDPEDISFIDPKTKTVVKLHGDIDSPSSMVFTKMDYTQYPKKNAAFVEWLKSVFLNHVVAFLGTSFEDPRLGEADDHILRLLGDFRLNPIIFFKSPEQEQSLSQDDFDIKMEDFQARCDEFEERDFIVIPLSSWEELPGILRDAANESQQLLRRRNPEDDRNINIIQSGRIEDLEEQIAGLLDDKTKQLCESLRPQGSLLPYRARMERAKQLEQHLQEKAEKLKPASLIEGYLALADAYAAPEGPEDIAKGRSFYRKAAAFFEKVEDKTPWANRLLRCHAKLLFMEGYEKEAVKTVENSEDPKSISLWLALLLDSGRLEPAEEFAEKQKKLHPSWACQVIAVLIAIGRVEEAEKHIENVLLDYKKQKDQGTLKKSGYKNENYPISLFFLTAHTMFEKALKVSGVVRPIRIFNTKLNEEGKALCSKCLHYIDQLYGFSPPSDSQHNEIMAAAVHLDMHVSALLQMYVRADEAAVNLLNVRPVRKNLADFIISRADYFQKEQLDILQKNLVRDYEASAWAWKLATSIQAFYLGKADEAWESIGKATEYAVENEEKDSIAQLAFDLGEISQNRNKADLIIKGLLKKGASLFSYFKAERLIKNGEPVQAEEILLTLLNENQEEPFRSNLLFALSRSAEKQKEWKRALEYLDASGSKLDLLSTLGGDRDYFLRKLHILTKIQDNTAILNTVRKIESMGLENENVLNVKAQAAHNLQKFDVAEQTYQRLYEQFGHNPFYARQRAEDLFWSGKVEKALDVLAPHIHNDESLDLDCLRLAAQIENTEENFDKAFSLLESCWKRIQDVPDLLLQMLTLGYRTGKEDRAHAAMMQLRALKNEGRLPEGMLAQVELNDLKKHFLQRRKSEKELQKHYLKGSLPRLGMCRFYNRPLYLDWAIRTQELTLDRDANNWIDFTTYATNGLRIKIENNRSQLLPIEVPEDVDEVVIDYSALITLHQLGLLEEVQKRFTKIYYPQILEMVWVNDQPNFTHHQKSKSETYKELQKRLDRGEIKQIAAPEPQKKNGDPMDSLDQRNLRLALLEKTPYLDNFIEKKDLKGFEQVQVLRLSQVAEWLFSRGKIGEKQFRSILQKHKSQKSELLVKEPEKIIEGSQRLVISEITLELLEEENLSSLMFDLGARILVEKATAFSIIGAAQSIRFVKTIGEKHREMVRIVKESPAFVCINVISGEDRNDDIYWQAAVAPFLYADSNRHLLLTDDRTLQMIPGKEGKNDSFGTDALLANLFGREDIPLEKYALDFYQLCKWRYRFLIPDVEILHFFANQYRKRPLGQHLNDLVDYSRHCLQDPGMFWGPEKTEPPLPLAFKFQMAWHDVWLELLVHLWSEGEWKEDELYNFTRKVFRQALPGLPENVAPEVRENLVQVEKKGIATRLFIATPNSEEPIRLHGLYELTFEYLGFDNDQKVRSLRDYVESAFSIPEIGDNIKAFRRGIFIPLLEAFYGTAEEIPIEPLLAEIYEKLDMFPGDVERKGGPLSAEQNELLEKIRESQKKLEEVEGPLVIISEPEKKERLVLAPHEMLANGLSPFRHEAMEYLLRPGKVSKKTSTRLKGMGSKIMHTRPSIWRPAARLAADVVLRDFKYCRSLFSQAMGMSPPNDDWVQAAWFNAVAKPDWDSAWDEAPSWIQELNPGSTGLQQLLQDALRNVLSEQKKMIDEEQPDFRESDPLIRALNWYYTNLGFLPFGPPLDPWSVIATVLNLEWNDREPKGAFKKVNAGKINFQEILEKALSWVVAKNGRDRVVWVLALNLVLNARGRNIDHDITISSSGKEFISFMNRCFKGLFEMDQESDSSQETIGYQTGKVLFHIRYELAANYMRSMALDEWDAASSSTQKSLLAWWMAREVTFVLDQVSSGMEAQHQLNWLKSVAEKYIPEIAKPNVIRHALQGKSKPLSVEYFVTLHGKDTLPAGSALAMIGPQKDGANPCFRAMVEPSRALTKPGRDGIFPVMIRQCAYGLNQIPVVDAIKPDVLWTHPATVTGPEFLQAYYGDEIGYLGDDKNGLIEFCKAISVPNFLDEALEQLPKILADKLDIIIAATFSGLRTYGLTRGHLPESAKILADTQLPEMIDRQEDITRQTVIEALFELLIQLRNWGESRWINDIESFLKALDVRKCEPFADSYTMGIGLATLQGVEISLWDTVVKTGKTEKKFRDALGRFKAFLNYAFSFLPAFAMDQARIMLSSIEDIPEQKSFISPGDNYDR